MSDSETAFVLGYVTASTQNAALALARVLVEERLVACANALPGMTSVFWWQGAVSTEQECVLILKTRRALRDRVRQRIVELHTYECPCVVFVDIVGGNPAYLAWLGEQTASESDSDLVS